MITLAREAHVRRTTKETEIEVYLNIDGGRRLSLDLKVPFFPHLVEALAFHAGWDLTLKARGDTHVDYHHVVEDVGIVLGEAFSQCLSDKKGIQRFGSALIPMDESLGMAAVDCSGRAYLVCDIPSSLGLWVGDFEIPLVEEFLRAFTSFACVTLHAKIWWGRSAHHALEALFKAVGRAFFEATRVVGDILPSTKGVL
ncbi:MAG: imidazoleglycerol-phosphate dehydratase HisB [Candidatus Caldatribacteriaceae bacterium]